jgi:hypothetical protein
MTKEGTMLEAQDLGEFTMNLGPFMTSIRNEFVRNEQELSDPITRMASCGEIDAVIIKGFEVRIVSIFARFHQTPASLEAELKRRGISEKWLYDNGVEHAMSIYEEVMGERVEGGGIGRYLRYCIKCEADRTHLVSAGGSELVCQVCGIIY